MKIAIIFPRFTGPYGGERLVLKLAQSLTSLNNSVTIYTHTYKTLDKSLTKNLKIIEGFYPSIKNHQLSTFLDLILMPLIVLKIKNKYDLILPIGWQSVFAAMLYKMFKSKKQKVIYYCLEPPRFAYDLKKDIIDKSKRFKKLLLLPIISLIIYLDKISVASVDNIISISEWTHDQIKTIYNRESVIIYPGVEKKRFDKLTRQQARQKLDIPNKKNIFLSVSKLHFRKRLDIAIKIFNEKKDDESIFFIIGDGPYKNEINKIIEKLDSHDISLLGKLSDEEVTLYMKAADFFIFTAQNEPFGIAPLEAAVAGCVVIPYKIKYTINDWQSVAKEHIDFYKKTL